MDSGIIKASWNDLAGRRLEFVEAFYARLFERYPHYRELFPEHLNTQLERMIEMISTLAQLADNTSALEPYLTSVGFAHRRTGIHSADVSNFVDTFLDTLATFTLTSNSDAERRAWREAFDDVIIPLFDEGLERGRDQPT